GDCPRLEGHTADGTGTGHAPDDLRMHGADVLGLGSGESRNERLESHAALRAGAGAALADLLVHRARVNHAAVPIALLLGCRLEPGGHVRGRIRSESLQAVPAAEGVQTSVVLERERFGARLYGHPANGGDRAARGLGPMSGVLHVRLRSPGCRGGTASTPRPERASRDADEPGSAALRLHHRSASSRCHPKTPAECTGLA